MGTNQNIMATVDRGSNGSNSNHWAPSETEKGSSTRRNLDHRSNLPTNGSIRHRRVKPIGSAKSNESLLGTLGTMVSNHQIGLSVNLLLLLFLTHALFPRARRRTRKFYELSYYDENTGTYTQGWDDLALVSFWIVVITGMRAATMDYVLKPWARMAGITKAKAIERFAEQAWELVYYVIFWPLGMYIMYNSDYWFNLREMWTHFPTRSMNGMTKWYYLVQFAFWLQQILVVNIEEKRKDYAQMFTHHIITSALLFMSYGYYQTKVGIVILCITGVVDFLLPSTKLLKYLGFQTACDIASGIFIIGWFVTRHVFYGMVCWSLYVDVPVAMPAGCYSSVTGEMLPPGPGLPANGGNEIWRNVIQPFRDPGGVVCFNENIRWSFLGLLLGLQVLILIWFAMIIKVATKVLQGGSADDVRSEDEGEESENEELEYDAELNLKTALLPLQEEEVGVEGLRFTRKASPGMRQYRRSAGRASGISIPGHSDHKELLGRIGCDKTS